MSKQEDAQAVAQLIERIGALARSDEAVGGLYPAQWAALRYLSRANRFSRTPAGLAKFLGATRGTVAQTLLALERKAFVIRTPNPRDKRSVTVELSEEGRALMAEDPLQALAREVEAAGMGDLPETRLRLEAVLMRLIARNGGRSFGLCRTCRYFRFGVSGKLAAPHLCGLLNEPLSDAEAAQICAEQQPAEE